MARYQPTEERRRQIAEAALAVIAEEGLGRFTTSAIAARVGLSEGALFRHFESKEEMVIAAMDLVEEALFADFPPTDPDPLERLGRFFRLRAALIVGQPAIGRLVFGEQLEHAAGERGAAKVAGWKTRNVRFVVETLREAQRAGSLREGTSPLELAMIVQGSLLSLVVFAAGGPVVGLSAESLWKTLSTLMGRS